MDLKFGRLTKIHPHVQMFFLDQVLENPVSAITLSKKKPINSTVSKYHSYAIKISSAQLLIAAISRLGVKLSDERRKER